MKTVKKTLFLALLIIFGCIFYIFAQGTQENSDLLETLKAQIEEARIEVDKKAGLEKKEDEQELRKKVKDKALKKEIGNLYRQASDAIRDRNYFRAIEIYDQLYLLMDSAGKEKIGQKINSCLAKLRVSLERQRGELNKKRQNEQLRLAKQLVQQREMSVKRREEKKALLKETMVKQHFNLGCEYLADKNYLQAIDEFEKVLNLEPSHRRVLEKLTKARELAYKKETKEVVETVDISKLGPAYKNKLIRDGFVQALKYLDSSDYRKAQEVFSEILEKVNEINLENTQIKTTRQIKQAAQKGPSEILSAIRSDKYDDAKKKLYQLIQKTATLARQKEEREAKEKQHLLTDSYLKNASDYLEKNEYDNAYKELQKAVQFDPENQEATALLEKLEDIIEVVK